jgi:hypothetical protein
MTHSNETPGARGAPGLGNASLLGGGDNPDSISNHHSAQAVKESRKALLRCAIKEHGVLLESLGVSIAEACFRGHDTVAVVHIRQARLVLLDAIKTANDLQAINQEAAR